jgi:hypothetical protein
MTPPSKAHVAHELLNGHIPSNQHENTQSATNRGAARARSQTYAMKQ